MAKVLIKELEPYRPLFIEEPVLAEQAEYYRNWRHKRIFHWRRVSACSSVSILNACWRQAVLILQPNLSSAGGLPDATKLLNGRSL
ncbi:enolase C-terminal domain-like protein [Escherichia coli]